MSAKAEQTLARARSMSTLTHIAGSWFETDMIRGIVAVLPSRGPKQGLAGTGGIHPGPRTCTHHTAEK